MNSIESAGPIERNQRGQSLNQGTSSPTRLETRSSDDWKRASQLDSAGADDEVYGNPPERASRGIRAGAW